MAAPREFKVIVLEDGEGVAKAAAEAFEKLAVECDRERGCFDIALSGGSTPRAVYSLLAQRRNFPDVPWERTRLFWGDERMVKPDSADSNYRMAYETLLKGGGIPIENIFPIRTGDLSAAEAAEKYERTLREKVSAQEEGFPIFDLVLLGIGPDGHTASLFPGTPAPLVADQAVTWCDPLAGNPDVKPAVERVTITAPVIWRARNVFVLAEGDGKRPVLAKLFASGPLEAPPVARLLWRSRGQVSFFIDKEAFPPQPGK